MASESEVIETTVGKVAAELAKRGLDPDDRITITTEAHELIPGRRASRARQRICRSGPIPCANEGFCRR
jgi:hypothetical protein